VLPNGSNRLAVLDQAAATALADAERSIPRPDDLERIRAAVTSLRSTINSLSEMKPTSAS
jgi:CRISPR/Cas system-associated protein Csm6